ncbi:MAG: hypothetical protein ACTSR2_00205 [Candidatus Hodarchaeales archaeon]
MDNIEQILYKLSEDVDMFISLFEPEVVWRNKEKDDEIVMIGQPIYTEDSSIVTEFNLSGDQIEQINDLFWDLVIEKFSAKLRQEVS